MLKMFDIVKNMIKIWLDLVWSIVKFVFKFYRDLSWSLFFMWTISLNILLSRNAPNWMKDVAFLDFDFDLYLLFSKVVGRYEVTDFEEGFEFVLPVIKLFQFPKKNMRIKLRLPTYLYFTEMLKGTNFGQNPMMGRRREQSQNMFLPD